MEDNILINLLDTYKPVTDKDIKIAKNYVALRERTANALSSRIDDILKDAAERITRICYQFNVDPQTFTISSSYNEEMFSQIADILDELEDEIFDLTLEYATDCTDDNDRLSTLIPWLLSLGRGNKNLRQTLEKRLWIFSRDLEAMIAAMRYAKRKMTDAVTRIKSNLHAVYVTPEVIAAIKSKKPFQATYIKSGGIKKGNAGNSNSEANNIQRFGEITVQMSWMRNLRMDYEENGAAGFIVRRGSNYDCPLCDEHVGFHKVDEIEHFPPFHGHCCCYAIGVYKKDELFPSEDKEKNKKEYEEYPKEKWDHTYYSNEGNGFVVTEKQRIEEANTSQNERDKYNKELRMAKVAADNGYKVEFLRGTNRKPGETYDIRLNGVPTDLKSTSSIGNIVNHIRKAYKKQGAKAVLIEFGTHDHQIYNKLNEAKRKYDIDILFYFTDNKKIRRM